MNNKPLVTLSVSNCNRLHYFKSCFESLYETTKDYPNREFIVVDCASVEEGTDKYLTELKGRGVNVKKFTKRDPVKSLHTHLILSLKIHTANMSS